MKKSIVIKLTNVSKKYFIHHDKPTLMERILKGKDEEFWALKNINLEVEKGDRIGIIGANGSGKTTLLKVITGITSPTDGKVITKGKVVSLIDLEAGFHPDLTGIQNIFLNGSLLGIGKKEITNKLDQIISFADIGKFIDAPMFTYSSGMGLRLGFSIAIHSNPEILVLDEGLAVGDESFKNKSERKLKELVKTGVTLLVATHVLDVITYLCSRVVWIDKGKVKEVGDINVINKYLDDSNTK